MKKILVPTDFSASAVHAANIAMMIGAKSNADIILFHSSNPNEGMNNSVYSPIFIHEYYEVKKQALAEAALQLKASGYAGNILPDYQIDFTVTSIVNAAEENNVDLIVMGSTGSSGLQGMIMGSTAGGVIVQSKHPVFVVPKDYVFSDNGTEAFVASDYITPVDERSVALLTFLKQNFAFKYTSVHVDKDSTSTSDTEKFLTDNFGDLLSGQLVLEGDYVTDTLLELREDKPRSILCTITKHRNWFERIFSQSVSKSLSHHGDVPLLCLQEKVTN
ncbi:MAG TPA: universal stress protein [Saprospiraceae bacterium]|nr:universal stress protein [Saprospiraceae bacterium]HQW55193.1 universal stress protein [Saprospiraceae bacterium]